MSELTHEHHEIGRQIRQHTARAADFGQIILSDLDRTLCHEFQFDPATNNHMPHVSPALVEAAQGKHLVVATGRRATSPALAMLWETGVVPETRPIIAENGGTLVHKVGSEIYYVDLACPEIADLMSRTQDVLTPATLELPKGQYLVTKLGRTMLVARLQDSQGRSLPEHQAWLAGQIRSILPTAELRATDTRTSVTVQHKDIDKRTAFRDYLSRYKILRNKIFVVGMGDAQNDAPIFAEADFSIGFSPEVHPLVDVKAPPSSAGIELVLNAL